MTFTTSSSSQSLLSSSSRQRLDTLPTIRNCQPATMGETKLRVAVVGTGMAGLVTAHLLAQDPRQRYHLTIFEKVARPFYCAMAVRVWSHQY